MAGMPAARKSDLTVHAPVIVATGSPDTTIGNLPAARLNDVATPCPLPPCKPPQGKIVSSSTTVFINNLGAARVGDAVLDGAGATPPGPGGCSHAAAVGYQARSQDHYEAIIAVEHEQSAWDEEKVFERVDYDGQRQEAATPTAATKGGAAAGGGGGSKAAGGGGLGGGVAPGKGGEDSTAFEDEAERAAQPKKLDLDFPIELELGSAGGSGAAGGAPNAIALGCFTVIVG